MPSIGGIEARAQADELAAQSAKIAAGEIEKTGAAVKDLGTSATTAQTEMAKVKAPPLLTGEPAPADAQTAVAGDTPSHIAFALGMDLPSAWSEFPSSYFEGDNPRFITNWNPPGGKYDARRMPIGTWMAHNPFYKEPGSDDGLKSGAEVIAELLPGGGLDAGTAFGGAAGEAANGSSPLLDALTANTEALDKNTEALDGFVIGDGTDASGGFLGGLGAIIATSIETLFGGDSGGDMTLSISNASVAIADVDITTAATDLTAQFETATSTLDLLHSASETIVETTDAASTIIKEIDANIDNMLFAQTAKSERLVNIHTAILAGFNRVLSAPPVIHIHNPATGAAAADEFLARLNQRQRTMGAGGGNIRQFNVDTSPTTGYLPLGVPSSGGAGRQ